MRALTGRLAYLGYCLKDSMSLKLDFWGFLLVSLFIFASRWVFFDIFFDFSGDLGGWSRAQVHLLFSTSILLVLLVNAFGASVHEFFYNVQQGEIEVFLTQPVSPYRLLLLRWFNFGQLAVFLALLCGLSAVPDLSELVLPLNARSLLFCALFAWGVAVNVAFLIMLESLTFLARRSLPVDFIYSELTRLMQLPPALLGQHGGVVLPLLLPAVLSAVAAADCLFHGVGRFTLAYLAGSSLLLTASGWMFRFLRSRFDGHGG